MKMTVSELEMMFEGIVGKKLPQLTAPVGGKNRMRDAAPLKFNGSGTSMPLKERFWGLGEKLPELFKRFEDDWGEGKRNVQGAALLKSAECYRPNVYGAGNRVLTLPNIVGRGAAALFCDILAEELGGRWDMGFYRYTWAADPMADHPRFNFSAEERKQLRGLGIAQAAKIMAHAIRDAHGVAREHEFPELMALHEKIRKGEVEVVIQRGRPQGATGTKKVSARLNDKQEDLLLQHAKLLGKLREDVNHENDINHKQTANLTTFIEKLNEVNNTLGEVVKKLNELKGDVKRLRHDRDGLDSPLCGF